MNPGTDSYIRNSKWQKELKKLRAIILGCPLTEELKWGKPCYTYQKSNIVILQGFKEFCALLFPKGALLKDSKHVLEKPGENTQGARRIPFTSVKEIAELKSVVKAYIKEAMQVEKSGLEVTYKRNPEPVP